MSVFEATNYKAVLRDRLLERKIGRKGGLTFTGMAEACGIQKTYLSRALNDKQEKTHLSSDQLYEAMEYLGFTPDERHYVTLLFEYSRSTIKKRKQELKEDIIQLRKKYRKTEGSLPLLESLPEDAGNTEFFMNPEMQLIHMFLFLERYRDNPDLIRQHLNLERDRFQQLLNQLLKFHIIEVIDGKYRVTSRKLHLSVDSPLQPAYRNLIRLKALEALGKKSSDKAYSFSVLFTSNEKTRKWIHQQFLKFLKDIEPKVITGQPEEVYQINFDLLPWSLHLG